MPFTDYGRNKLLDAAHRNQAHGLSATRYIALFTASPTPSTGGTELAASGYARVQRDASLANWSGTQGAGTTVASSGTSGEISNNADVEFDDAIPAAWAGIVAWGQFDASSGGNLICYGPIVDSGGNPVTRSFATGDPVVFAAGALVCRMPE
jgi:hypothetical protein